MDNIIQKPTLPFVETMLTQVCNLSCTGCTNYSDLKFSGFVPWDQGKDQLTKWLEKINLPDFGLMGGEPLINPQVREWISGTRELLPDSQIRFTTNGLLLEKHFDVVDLMKDIGNSVFKISVHVNDQKINSVIDKIFKRYDWEPVTEYGIDRWKSGNFRLQINRPTHFTKSYKGTYSNMEPHDSDPSTAFNACCQQQCPLLYNGTIYKCSTSGLLSDLLNKVGQQNKESWKSFLNQNNTMITPQSSIDSIIDFINNFGNPHSICRMCPKDAAIDHISTVTFK